MEVTLEEEKEQDGEAIQCTDLARSGALEDTHREKVKQDKNAVQPKDIGVGIVLCILTS